VLQIDKGLGHQDCASQQYERKRRLKHDKSLLRKRRAVARGAVGSAQDFRRLCMGGQPRRAGAEENARRQRDQKCKAKNREGRAGSYGHISCIGKCESKNGVRCGIGNGQPGQAADAAQ
jgi:hypothetical protein